MVSGRLLFHQQLTIKQAYGTTYSQAVTHPSTNMAQCCLTSVIGRELVCSTWYGRRQDDRGTLRRTTNQFQVENVQQFTLCIRYFLCIRLTRNHRYYQDEVVFIDLGKIATGVKNTWDLIHTSYRSELSNLFACHLDNPQAGLANVRPKLVTKCCWTLVIHVIKN